MFHAVGREVFFPLLGCIQGWCVKLGRKWHSVSTHSVGVDAELVGGALGEEVHDAAELARVGVGGGDARHGAALGRVLRHGHLRRELLPPRAANSAQNAWRIENV